MANRESNISPLDDRYREDVGEMASYFSESALVRYRVRIEIEYLIALGRVKGLTELNAFSPRQQDQLRSLYRDFTARDYASVKKAESRTRHDVKAVEYFLRRKFDQMGFGSYQTWIHYALTSEDVNNLAYTLIWQDAVRRVYLPALTRVHMRLRTLARRYRNLPILALTHGQPATPTSLGKEIAVFVSRLSRQSNQLKENKLEGKLSGATGTWSAHVVSHPNVNWITFTKRFVSSLGLEPNLLTTQIQTYDSLAESYHIFIRINTVLLDFCRDAWLYISRGIFIQRTRGEEVGSSTMPHKVNPIHFENAEGNLGIANAYFSHLAQTLPVSRLQRDLSGSTVIRNQGVPLAHSLLACKNIVRGLDRIRVDKAKIKANLNRHWEVLGEAIQTVLRKSGDKESYEQLKDLTRREKVTKDEIRSFVQNLDIPEYDKRALLALTPEDYTGLASKVVDEM